MGSYAQFFVQKKCRCLLSEALTVWYVFYITEFSMYNIVRTAKIYVRPFKCHLPFFQLSWSVFKLNESWTLIVSLNAINLTVFVDFIVWQHVYSWRMLLIVSIYSGHTDIKTIYCPLKSNTGYWNYLYTPIIKLSINKSFFCVLHAVIFIIIFTRFYL